MPRILLIDDDAQLGPPLAAYFQRFDLRWSRPLRPSAGLARLAQGGFDAAILDVMLPEMDGFELCRTIRRRQRHPHRHAHRARRRDGPRGGLELGADDYLPKALRAARAGGPRADRAAPARGTAHPLPPRRCAFDGLTVDPATRAAYSGARGSRWS
jgi:two-component system OmpR family response regulator